MVDSDGPRATVEIVIDGRSIPLGSIGGATCCDLGLLDGLLRLRLAVSRRGWGLRLRGVDDELRGLAELAGVTDCLGIEPRPPA
jgi:hypothetical protein